MSVSSRFILVCCIGSLFAVCGAAEPLLLTAEDSGKTVSIKPGDTVKITLVSNPTTGYGWSFFLPADGSLQTVKDDFVEPENNGMTGVPGKHVFMVKAVKPGTRRLFGFYFRPWEKMDPAKDTHFTLTVNVKGTSKNSNE